MVFTLFRMGFSLHGYPTDRLYYHATDELTMGIAFPETDMSGGARSVELCLCDITFRSYLISIYFNLSY